MTQWTAISRHQHTNTNWQPRQRFHFAINQQTISILLPELGKLLPHLVLGFVERDETYQPVALLGIGGERNVYVNHDGQWLASYVPAMLRGYPFALADTDQGEKALCIREDHLKDGPDTEPLFDADGDLAEGVRRNFEFLQQCEKARQTTRAASAALTEAGLIEPWSLTVNRGEGQEPVALKGLFRINESRLNELDANSFADLRPSGALLLAYAQLFSIHQVDQLGKRASHLGQQDQAQAAASELRNLFDDDDSLNFDFLDNDPPGT